MKPIAVGSDQNGLELASQVAAHLRARGFDIVEYTPGADSEDDYPDVAGRVSRAIVNEKHERAILVCGTGLGMAIAANKFPGIRAASVTDTYSAERARKSNDAQVLCLGSEIVGRALALTLVDHWLASEFAGGASTRKLEKLKALDALTFSADS